MKQYVDVIGLHTSCMEAMDKPLTQLWARVKTAYIKVTKSRGSLNCNSGATIDQVLQLVVQSNYYRDQSNIYKLFFIANALGIDPSAFLSDKPQGVYSLEIELV